MTNLFSLSLFLALALLRLSLPGPAAHIKVSVALQMVGLYQDQMVMLRYLSNHTVDFFFPFLVAEVHLKVKAIDFFFLLKS